jgi:calcineurin-like phosphoesterase family protein
MIVVRNRTWLISDTHFGHHGITKFGQRSTNHELIMLSNWIDRVPEVGTVLHLGDVFMGSDGNAKRWAKVVKRLPGRKFAIMGNHDKEEKLLELAGFEVIAPFEQEGVLFTHEPIATWDESLLSAYDWHTNVHGHTHANEPSLVHDGMPVPGKRYINVCVEHTNLAPIQFGSLGVSKEKPS